MASSKTESWFLRQCDLGQVFLTVGLDFLIHKEDKTKLRGYWKTKGNNICKALFGIANRYEVSFGGNANVLKLDYGNGCTSPEIN